DVWLQGCGKESDTCHGNYVGSWNTDHTDFTRTHLSGNLTRSATAGTTGISVNYNGHSYTGVWDTNPGESRHVQVAGAGALSGLTAEIGGNCKGSCLASGRLYKAGEGGVDYAHRDTSMTLLAHSAPPLVRPEAVT